MGLNENLRKLHAAGVSIWLDSLSRELLDSNEFAALVRDHSVTGATSNPTIFARAIVGSSAYDGELRSLAAAGVTETRELFFRTALEDVRRAASELRPEYESSGGTDGFVSFECTPDLADDTAGTIEQALELWSRLDLPNVMIKVPATAAGVPAIEELTAQGVNVNVTLLFSVERYAEVMEAYMRGLERRVEAGKELESIASVASFFVSRVDAKADSLLPADSPLRGRVAIANAHLAYSLHSERLASQRWLKLAKRGAHAQRPLWASTGTKDPGYSDVLYIESLIARGVVNTMPKATLQAFADHGVLAQTIDDGAEASRRVLEDAANVGLDLAAITAELEREGVEAFSASYTELIRCIESKLPA